MPSSHLSDNLIPIVKPTKNFVKSYSLQEFTEKAIQYAYYSSISLENWFNKVKRVLSALRFHLSSVDHPLFKRLSDDLKEAQEVFSFPQALNSLRLLDDLIDRLYELQGLQEELGEGELLRKYTDLTLPLEQFLRDYLSEVGALLSSRYKRFFALKERVFNHISPEELLSRYGDEFLSSLIEEDYTYDNALSLISYLLLPRAFKGELREGFPSVLRSSWEMSDYEDVIKGLSEALSQWESLEEVLSSPEVSSTFLSRDTIFLNLEEVDIPDEVLSELEKFTSELEKGNLEALGEFSAEERERVERRLRDILSRLENLEGLSLKGREEGREKGREGEEENPEDLSLDLQSLVENLEGFNTLAPLNDLDTFFHELLLSVNFYFLIKVFLREEPSLSLESLRAILKHLIATAVSLENLFSFLLTLLLMEFIELPEGSSS